MRPFLLYLFLIQAFSVSAWTKPVILVSIKPLYGLVAKITKGMDCDLELLYAGERSPHTAGLTMDDAGKIKKADIIFWVGAVYETALAKHLNTHEKAFDLSKVKDLTLLPYRTFDGEGKRCGCHHESPNKEGRSLHHTLTLDGHYWLDVNNAIALIKAIATALSEKAPNHRALIASNKEAAIKALSEFGTGLKSRLKPVSYVTFHDFTQYFDSYFGTTCMNVVVVDPHAGGPNLKHMERLMGLMEEQKIKLIIKEKQFKGDILTKLSSEGEDVMVKTLDYLGTDLPADDFVYERILQHLVEGFQ